MDLVVTKPGSTSQLITGIDDYSPLVVKKSDRSNLNPFSFHVFQKGLPFPNIFTGSFSDEHVN